MMCGVEAEAEDPFRDTVSPFLPLSSAAVVRWRSLRIRRYDRSKVNCSGRF